MKRFNALKCVVQLSTTLLVLVILQACAIHQNQSLYEDIGGRAKIEQLSDAFIDEIQYNKSTLGFFLDADVDRFREKFIEHICANIGGPCDYTGDDMVQVHKGMNISEADFNRIVELLINAMNKVDIPHRLQNQVLARLAPMRDEIIYQ